MYNKINKYVVFRNVNADGVGGFSRPVFGDGGRHKHIGIVVGELILGDNGARVGEVFGAAISSYTHKGAVT